MPSHAEDRYLPYTQAQLFELVADIERYPEFLPWCRGARVTGREGDVLRADLMVGFGMVRERFSSRVTLSRPHRIDVAYLRGPFRRLDNHWVFTPQADGCRIGFHIDFEFRSRLLRRLMGPLFLEAVRRMVAAFEGRARALYGGSGAGAPVAAA